MENATEALLMAFAVLVFIIALSVAFSSLSQAKSTADVVLYYSDRENFQTMLEADNVNVQDGGRTVSVDTVIATIARCIKEKFTVKIIEGSEEYNFEYDVKTAQEIENEFNRFLTNYNKDAKYRETYVEVTTSGYTYDAGDGTSLEQDVGKKIYITYTKK